MLTKLIINCETGEQTEVELTTKEIAQREADTIAFAKQKAKDEAEAQAKAELKASAFTKLAELGLTEDEAKAIAG
jgi:hypothetical protein